MCAQRMRRLLCLHCQHHTCHSQNLPDNWQAQLGTLFIHNTALHGGSLQGFRHGPQAVALHPKLVDA